MCGLEQIVDPNDEIIKVHLAAQRWDMQQRRFGLVAERLDKRHALSVELLEMLKKNMPDQTGRPKCWNFEKHTAFSTTGTTFFCSVGLRTSLTRGQGPEHGHIDNCKRLTSCTNNKDYISDGTSCTFP
jgi:hypothetical protein